MNSTLEKKFKSSMAKETKSLPIIPTTIYATCPKQSARERNASLDLVLYFLAFHS